MSTADRTDETPQRRLAVARATFSGDIEWTEALKARLSANVCTAVKHGLPFSDMVQWTHIDVFFSEEPASCTVSVQAYARGPIGWAAKLGAGAAFPELDGDVTITLVQEQP
ncbi:MAG: hypothetical protein ACPHK8_01090 [Thermoplasmatota archaeon]